MQYFLKNIAKKLVFGSILIYNYKVIRVKEEIYMVTLDKIYHASYVLKDVVIPTPLVKATAISDDCEVYLKPENLQIAEILVDILCNSAQSPILFALCFNIVNF